MISTKKVFEYEAFGLKIFSDIELPELSNCVDENPAILDVCIKIKIKDLSHEFYRFHLSPNKFIVEDNNVMFQVKDTAIFSIQDGNKIIVSPFNNLNHDKIRLFILGTCMGALFLQRKILPLHGSLVAISGKAYAFVGNRGAGKSTLAAAFVKEGYSLLSDDLIPLTLTSTNTPIVSSTYPQQKLWLESLEGFGLGVDNYKPLFERETKFAVPVTSNYLSTSLPLAGVFEIVKSEQHDIEVTPILNKLESIHTLSKHTFRNILIPKLGLSEWHFKNLTSFINKIDIYRLKRPTSSFTANELSNIILDTINNKGCI